MIFLFLFSFLISTPVHPSEAIAELPALSSEQVVKVEQLMDEYPAEELLDTLAVMRPDCRRNADDTITPLSDDELKKQIVFLSCDNKDKVILTFGVPILLKELTLHEKMLLISPVSNLSKNLPCSLQEEARVKEIIKRINIISQNWARSKYVGTLQQHQLSKDELEIMKFYHHGRFEIESIKLLQTLLEKELSEKGTEEQHVFFKNMHLMTYDTMLNLLKMDIIGTLKENQKQ